MINLIIIALLLAGWTAAWLNWCFNGEIRQFVVSRFPEQWIGEMDRSEIAHMDNDEFVIYMCTAPLMPEFLRGVLTCPSCLSAHIAGAGAFLASGAITNAGGVGMIPLVWATGAVIGFFSIKKHL